MQVKLDEPGAGLPMLESLVLRLVFRMMTKLKSREDFVRLYRKEEDEIKRLVKGLDSELGMKPKLVKRVTGMEDSSRNWSVFMTLQHLNIVNHGLSEVMKKLSSEATKGSNLVKIKIEDVKPDPAANEENFTLFVRMNDLVMEKISRLDELHTEMKHEHPWFGKLDAFQWLALLGVHMRVHRKQIERIINQLEK